MQAAFKMGLGLAVLVALVVAARADDKGGQEKTLKGTITCAKCDLGKEAKCMTVIVTKEKGKETVYYFDPTASKKYHGKICTTPTPGSVEGTVKTEGDKKIVTPTKVNFSK